jgi:hypothetical protein
MNILELFVYNALKRTPRLKLFVRDIYQALLDTVPVTAELTAYPIANREGFFYGFHDHTPFSSGNDKLLGCQYNPSIPLRMPLPEDELTVGFFNGKSLSTWNPVAKTTAWNWHQGCKVFWVGQNDAIVFNDRENGMAISRLIALGSGKIIQITRALGSISPNGKWAVAYNFNRVERYMPGYGYQNLIDTQELEKQRPLHDGMYLIDMETGTEKLLFSIADVAELIDNEPSMRGAFHFFSHTIFSPSSKRFVFLHRWTRGDVRKRWSRLLTSDLNGQDIHVFNHREMASHIAWLSDNEFLAYCRTSGGRDGYVLFTESDPRKVNVIACNAFNSDGHPSFIPASNAFVTDTYPDRHRRQTLNIYDMQSGIRYDIARLKTYRHFASLYPYRHWCCDLHPRMDRIGRYICFDATYTGVRGLCTIDLGAPYHSLSGVKSLNHVYTDA